MAVQDYRNPARPSQILVRHTRTWRIKYTNLTRFLHFLLVTCPEAIMNYFDDDARDEMEKAEENWQLYSRRKEVERRQRIYNKLMERLEKTETDGVKEPPALEESRQSKEASAPVAATETSGGEGPEIIEKIEEVQLWTLSHAYYANMGGLVGLKYALPSHRRNTSFSRSGGYHEPSHDTMEHPIIRGDDLAARDIGRWDFGHPLTKLWLSSDDIDDKSKADWIARIVAIVQITRLLITIINRRKNDQPITQIELTAGAFAIFAVVTYMVNWYKPKDVNSPTLVHMLVDETPTEGSAERLAVPFFTRIWSPSRRITRKDRILNDELWFGFGQSVLWPLIMFSTAAFGGINYIGRTLYFPTVIEGYLWWGSSLYAIGLLFLVYMIIRVSISINDKAKRKGKVTALQSVVPELKVLLETPDEWWETLASVPKVEAMDDEDAAIQQSIHNRAITWYGIFYYLLVMYGRPETMEADGQRARVLPSGSTRERLQFRLWEHLGPLMGDDYTLTSRIPPYWDEYERLVTEEFLRTTNRDPGSLPNFVGELGIHEFVHRIIQKEQVLNHAMALQNPEHAFTSHLRRNQKLITLRKLRTIYGFFYILTRISLIALMFSSLREVPKAVYDTPDWTRYLPGFS